MKVVTGDSVTMIYPFVRPDAEYFEATSQIIVYPNGTIKLWIDRALMSAEIAQKLIEALLHATEIAEKGREEDWPLLGNSAATSEAYGITSNPIQQRTITKWMSDSEYDTLK